MLPRSICYKCLADGKSCADYTVHTSTNYKVARRHKLINTTCNQNYFRFIFFRTTNIFGRQQFYTTTSTHHVKIHIHQVSHQILHTLNHLHYNKIYWIQFNGQLDLSTSKKHKHIKRGTFSSTFQIYVYLCASVAHYSFFTQYDQDKIRNNSWIT